MKYDQHENCAKCGYPGKTVEYRAYEVAGSPAIVQDDFLLIKCSRCAFKWTRDCLDKEEE